MTADVAVVPYAAISREEFHSRLPGGLILVLHVDMYMNICVCIYTYAYIMYVCKNDKEKEAINLRKGAWEGFKVSRWERLEE